MKKYILKHAVLLCSFLLFFNSCKHDENVLPGNTPSVLIKTSVKLEVGGIIYENLDAHVRIKGYDSNNATQWMRDYNFVGPVDTLEAKNGFHHYSIELINKWGVNDIQSGITVKDIWDGRADGAHPMTCSLGGQLKAKKLSKCITLKEANVNGLGIVYQLDSKTLYNYTADSKLQSIRHETYDKQTSLFTEVSTDTFLYDGDVVTRIITTSNGQPHSEYQRIYGNNYEENKLTLNENGLAWTLITTSSGDNDMSRKVNANYIISNGSSLLHTFDFSYHNIVSDQFIQDGALCAKGKYLYDKSINPFAHLGYIDFFLKNSSINNRLMETIAYDYDCSHPNLSPLSHHYTYDQEGYPIKEIITYIGTVKGVNGNNAPSPYHDEVDFYYE